MRKRIYRSLCMVGIVGVLLTAVLSAIVSFQLTADITRQDVREMADILSGIYDDIDPQDEAGVERLLSSVPENVRVSYIGSDGTVLYDSAGDTRLMKNHRNRREIEQAQENGTGQASRLSDTLGNYTYYYAVRLDDGTVLRLATAYSGIWAGFSRSGIITVLLIVVVVFCALKISKRMTQRLLMPVEQVAVDLENINEDLVYEELVPFLTKIRRQREEIEEQIAGLQMQRDTISVITKSMKEGLVFLSSRRVILSINQSAIRLLTGRKVMDKYSVVGRELMMLSRLPELNESVDRALEGKSADAAIHVRGRILHVFANPASIGDEVDGAVVVIIDETERRLAEQMRQEFSANVSHELKTPLTSISGYAEMMECGLVSSEKDMKEFAARIHKEALRLIALIEDIIRLSRIEESGTASFIPCSLREIAASAVDSLQTVAERDSVTLTLSGEAGLVCGDSVMLYELIYNLTENAIKYNRVGGKVDVSIWEENDRAVFCVKDTGVGIPEDSQRRVFERFYRVDKSRSKLTGGTGLGLSIVKHIAERHGARIELHSTYGVGTEISVFFPLMEQKE